MSTLSVNNVTEVGGAPVVTGGVLDSGSLPTGTILQVVSTTKVNSFSTTSTSYTDVTDLSVSITPTSSSNKILVLVNANMSSSTANYFAQIVRNSTAIANGTSGSITNAFVQLAPDAPIAYQTNSISMNYLDSPATTSSTTYKVQVTLGAAGTLYLNRRAYDTSFGASSTITVMEVAG